MAKNKKEINGNPTKTFFVDMITKDIGLVECILDLVDNSIDSLIRRYKLNVMEYLMGKEPKEFQKTPSISIKFDKDIFSIEDTCGGITIEDAKEKVFRFGILDGKNKTDIDNTGLSVYGIGMKRALFKLGNNIKISSRTENSEFTVDIDVEEWKTDPDDWDFDFSDKKIFEKKYNGQTGTKIEVNNLNKSVASRFQLSNFQTQIMEKISSAYSLFIKRGVKITVNSLEIKPSIPKIGISKRIKTVRKKLKYNKEVDILIFAGLSEKSDKVPRGWYVFCNGRMVLERDQTKETGWGDNFPEFHSKFNHFIGYVYFWSTNEKALPWTTTKLGVDVDSPVYQTTLNHMKIQGRPITNFLSNMYPDELYESGIAEREILKETKSKTLDQLSTKSSTFKYIIPKKKESKEVSIQYKRPKEQVAKVKQGIGKKVLPASKVGEYTFDYFLKTECE